MKKIILVRNTNSYLPEIDAYIKYFNKTKLFEAFDSSKLNGVFDLNEFDIIWEFKGFGGVRNKKRIIVHEYASLSTGPFNLTKDKIKSRFNPKPDMRIFLNNRVKEGLNFNDNIEYSFRDMGIDESFINVRTNKNPIYDFVYVGSICRERNIDLLLKEFTKKCIGKICLVGKVDDYIYKKYRKNKDIIFTGKVPYSEVPKIASQSEYGVNYMPNIYPFNIQTSTKLLEYLALGLKIVTSNYEWVRNFEKKYHCNFYKFDNNNINFNKEELNKYKFKSNINAHDFLWPNIIKNAGIVEKLKLLV